VGVWNILATSLEGRRDALLVSLRKLGQFRPAGYRNVVAGLVADREVFLGRVRDALRVDMLLPTALAKIVPVDATLRFEPVDPLPALADAVEPMLDRLGGGTFFVRCERRGLKGRLHSPTLERDLADRIWRALEARGHTPRVAFQDPDAVLVVETLGDEAGIGVITRALRQQYPFVKVR
jgi:tRNA(Ser,Leu) C12 N-acetylase TAN1